MKGRQNGYKMWPILDILYQHVPTQNTTIAERCEFASYRFMPYDLVKRNTRLLSFHLADQPYENVFLTLTMVLSDRRKHNLPTPPDPPIQSKGSLCTGHTVLSWPRKQDTSHIFILLRLNYSSTFSSIRSLQ